MLIVCMMLIGIGVSVTSPYLSLYCTEKLGMSTSAFGLFMAVSSLSGVFVNMYVAKRSDNGWNRKRIIILAAVSAALAYGSYLAFQDYLLLLIAVTLFMGFGAPVIPQLYAYAQEAATASRSDDKTFAMSTLRSLFSLGFLIGPLVGTLILDAFGYDGLFTGTTMIYAVVSFLVFLFLQSRTPEPRASGKANRNGASSPANAKLRLPFIAFVLLFMVNFVNSLNTPLFIVNVLGGTHANVGVVVSVCAGLEIPIMLLLGALGRRISTHNLILYGCAVSVAYFAILSVATAPWQLVAAQLLQATFVAIVMGNGLSYFAEKLPESPGMATTLYSNGSTIGKLLGNLGGGVIAQFTGFRHVNWACMAIVAVAFLILWGTRSQETVTSA